MDYFDEVKEAADAIAARVSEIPRIAVVLGSGLGDFAGTLTEGVPLPYGELPHWPAARVIGHEGRLVVGVVRGRTSTIDGKAVSREASSAFTFPFNMTGEPSASVPCGFTRDGLPIGLQITGRRFEDVTVLRASAALEAARPWADRRPALG